MPEEFDRRRILVVDDDERMVRFIRMNLEHDGFQVAEAFNGKQAIQKLRDTTPDLILLDVMLPDIDGFEVLETIREGLRPGSPRNCGGTYRNRRPAQAAWGNTLNERAQWNVSVGLHHF